MSNDTDDSVIWKAFGDGNITDADLRVMHESDGTILPTSTTFVTRWRRVPYVPFLFLVTTWSSEGTGQSRERSRLALKPPSLFGNWSAFRVRAKWEK